MENITVESVGNFDHLEPVPLRHVYSLICLFFVCFQVVGKVVKTFQPPKGVAEHLYWKWRNVFISWIHAVVVGTLNLGCILLIPEMRQDLLAYHDVYVCTSLAISTGYFLHDTIDMVVNGYALACWELMIHHVMIFGSYTYALSVSRYVAFGVMSMLCEVNSIFLHARKLLQMSRYDYNRPLWKAVIGANLVSFVVFRFGVVTTSVYALLNWQDRIRPAWFFKLEVVIVGCLWIIQMVLFWRLLKNDVLRNLWRTAKSPAKHDGIHTNGGNGLSNGAPLSNNNNISNGFKSKDS